MPQRVTDKASMRRLASGLLAALLAASTSGCSLFHSADDALFGQKPQEGTLGYVAGFLGGVVADEPRAALAARDVLSSGGNAADAAVVLGFSLAVTLPSRAGLGSGGACIAYNPRKDGPNGGVPEAVLFTPLPPAAPSGDRPAAVPMLARGLFALHARYGKRPFETMISPAEQMARFGVPASRAFIRDLGVVAGPLAADPQSRAIFFAGGMPLAEGATMVQTDLAATLSQIRTSGVGDFYQGLGSRRIADASVAAGGGFTTDDLRRAIPRLAPVVSVPSRGNDTAAFLPPPADGGLAAAAAFEVLRSDPAAVDAAKARSLGTATLWRRGGGDPKAVLTTDPPPADLPTLPASTTFATLDRDGNAVVCALTMDNLFGTGRVAPGTGMVLAASPSAVPMPLLSAGLVYNGNIRAFRALAGGSGQEAAPLAAAYALTQAIADRGNPPTPMANPVPDPGRANVIECNALLPGDGASCAWATDPRGAGLAVGSTR